MNDTTRGESANPTAPGAAPTPRWLRVALVALSLAAMAAHLRIARQRSAAWLEHDEAISLLAAAGTSDKALALYDDSWSSKPEARSASDLQSWLHAANDASFSDVTKSLKLRDIHPPLYFWILNAAQRAGLKSETSLRLIGSFILLVAVVIADRWVWQVANPLGRMLGFGLLLLSPVLIETATELRQYSLVALGVVLSLAALYGADASHRSGLRLAILIAIAPALLIYSHFGTLIWIAPWIVALLQFAIRNNHLSRRLPFAGLALAIAIAIPLLIVYYAVLTNRTSATHANALPASVAVLRVLSNLGAYFFTVPWRFRNDWLLVGIAVAAICGTWWIAIRATRIERTLALLSLVWLTIWIGLLVAGKLPPHATAAKYLLPCALTMIVLFVRASSNRVVITMIGMGLLSHTIALPDLLWSTPTDASLTAELQQAKSLLVDDPKRGYLFPVIAELSQEATVTISRPETMLKHARTIESLGDPLIWLEIKPMAAAPESIHATRLHDELTRQYQSNQTLRDGPRRRLTMYRDRAIAARDDKTE